VLTVRALSGISAFLEWMRDQCECLEGSCLVRHEATWGRFKQFQTRQYNPLDVS